jgi:hypothetical protein
MIYAAAGRAAFIDTDRISLRAIQPSEFTLDVVY